MKRKITSIRPLVISENSLKIFWTTDCHIRNDVGSNPSAPGALAGNRYYYLSPQKVEAFVVAVNLANPDLAICTGDMIDRDASFEIFLDMWEQINSPSELVIGNHEFDANTYSSIVSSLGWEERPMLGNSKFNRSFSLTNETFGVRCIILDTNYTEVYEHGYTNYGRIHADDLTWLENEINLVAEDVILVFTHHAPAAPSNFISADAQQLMSVLASSNKKIYNLTGHHHLANITRYQKHGEVSTSYVAPALVEQLQQDYAILYINPNGDIITEQKTL